MMRTDDSGAAQVPPADSRTLNHMVRKKSSLGVLNIERDWLHIGTNEQYAFEMNMRRKLLLVHDEEIYVTDPVSVAAEQEVLEMAVTFVLEHFPKRFSLENGGDVIRTRTPGYDHRFVIAGEFCIQNDGFRIKHDGL